jgi:hypothetical protein
MGKRIFRIFWHVKESPLNMLYSWFSSNAFASLDMCVCACVRWILLSVRWILLGQSQSRQHSSSGLPSTHLDTEAASGQNEPLGVAISGPG